MSTQPELHTQRLFMRSLKISDAESLLMYRSNALANKYQAWIPKTLDDSKEFINNRIAPHMNQANSWFQFAIIKKETNELIGDIGIHFFDLNTTQVEIGFTLDQNHQGKGFACEALSETLNYLFNTLHKEKVIASIDAQNKKSIHLVSRLGFLQEEKNQKECKSTEDDYFDEVIYTLLKTTWNEKNKSVK